MSSLKEIIRNRFKNYVVVILLMAVIALLSIIFLIMDCPDWVDVLANSVLGAVIGASLVDLACSVAAGKEAEEDMRKGIMETLCPDGNAAGVPELYNLYKKDAIEPILNQCLSAYCADKSLSAGYLSYIKNSCRNIKRNERYIVEVNRDSDGVLHIRQSLKHTAIFKPDTGQRPYFQAYFIFKTRSEQTPQKGELDQVLGDKSYFFREELPDDTFVQELIDDYNAAIPSGEDAVKDAVISKLKFFVDIFFTESVSSEAVRIKNADYEVTLNPECGVKIKTYIPQECLIASDQFFEEEGFVQYTACMNAEYRIPSSQNTLYIVYALPTINPYFRITFNMGIDRFAEKYVEKMPFLSIDQSVGHTDPNDGKVVPIGTSLIFSTSRTVFPRSGISFSWDA